MLLFLPFLFVYPAIALLCIIIGIFMRIFRCIFRKIPKCKKSAPDHHHREHDNELEVYNHQKDDHDDNTIPEADAHYFGAIIQVNADPDHGLNSSFNSRSIVANEV